MGKETALKLVASCKSCDASCDLVERVRQWRDDSLEEGTCNCKSYIISSISVSCIRSESIQSRDKAFYRGEFQLALNFVYIKYHKSTSPLGLRGARYCVPEFT